MVTPVIITFAMTATSSIPTGWFASTLLLITNPLANQQEWLDAGATLGCSRSAQLNGLNLVGESVLEEWAMVSLRQRLQCLPILLGGLGLGLLLALSTRIGSGTESTVVALVAALPFVLATLTGVAKTTTA